MRSYYRSKAKQPPKHDTRLPDTQNQQPILSLGDKDFNFKHGSGEANAIQSYTHCSY